jgi:hypothetical protein
MDPGSAAHQAAKSGALRSIRGTEHQSGLIISNMFSGLTSK